MSWSFATRRSLALTMYWSLRMDTNMPRWSQWQRKTERVKTADVVVSGRSHNMSASEDMAALCFATLHAHLTNTPKPSPPYAFPNISA